MKLPSHITCVEPHSDDAFLSIGQHIEDWIALGVSVSIVTLIPVLPASLRNSEAYAKAVGAAWIGYTYLGAGAPFGKRLKLEGQVVLPLGAAPLDQNPHTQDHWNVRRWLEPGLTSHSAPWYYVDMPYAITRKNEARMNALMHDMHVVSYLKPPARKWRHTKLFTAQAKFFYFNKDGLPKTFELLLRKGGTK